MKAVSKHDDHESMRKVLRRLFELQMELEDLSGQSRDYHRVFKDVIKSLDDLFEDIIHDQIVVA